MDKHGYTASCPACDLIRAGVSREGVHQTEFCRARLVGKLEETAEGRRRLDAAKRKEGPSKVRKVEKLDERSEDRSTVSVPGPGSGSRSAEKRDAEEPSSQEASPPKKAHTDTSKRARVESKGESVASTPGPRSTRGQSAASAPGPGPSVPESQGMEVSEESTSSRKRSLETEDEMVTNFLLSLRVGFLSSIAGGIRTRCVKRNCKYLG